MNVNDYVIFTGTNATPYQEAVAKKALIIGAVYQVEHFFEGNWWTHISLKGVKGKFAIEMFSRDFKKPEVGN